MGFDIDIRVLKGQMYAGADGHEEKTQLTIQNENNKNEEDQDNQDNLKVSTIKNESEKNIAKYTKKKKRNESIQRSIQENFR